MVIGEEIRREQYQVYIAEALRCIGESTAKYAGGPYMTARWTDIANQKPQDDRDPDEIAAEVIRKAGLVTET